MRWLVRCLSLVILVCFSVQCVEAGHHTRHRHRSRVQERTSGYAPRASQSQQVSPRAASDTESPTQHYERTTTRTRTSGTSAPRAASASELCPCGCGKRLDECNCNHSRGAQGLAPLPPAEAQPPIEKINYTHREYNSIMDVANSWNGGHAEMIGGDVGQHLINEHGYSLWQLKGMNRRQLDNLHSAAHNGVSFAR